MQLVEPLRDHRVDLGERLAFELSVIPKDLPHGHALVEPALFRQVADLITGRRPAVAVEDPDLAGIGPENVHDHPDRRRFARSVRADEPVDRPFRYREAQLVDGDDGAELFGDVVDFDGVHGEFPAQTAQENLTENKTRAKLNMGDPAGVVASWSLTLRNERDRLISQLDRDLAAHTSLKTLLTDAAIHAAG